MSITSADLLSLESVETYLLDRGLLSPGVPLKAHELGGGVSNIVIAVTAGRLRAVVKQSLPKLRVADEWLAKQERIITEAHALQLAGRVSPGSVPQVLDIDSERNVIVIDRAPDTWVNYKDQLLEGRVDERIAERLGKVLGEWHSATASPGGATPSMEGRLPARSRRERAGVVSHPVFGGEWVSRSFDDIEAFDQLRLDPYHRTVAKRMPEFADQIDRYLEELVSSRSCLVHGDFSPKNVLYGTQEMWVLDFEVAHFGNPVFDLAFMLNHFMLKAIHRPKSFDEYRASSLGFWSSYREARHGTLARERSGERKFVLYTESSSPNLTGHVACLMLARVEGKSPAEYLTEQERDHARSFGSKLLLDPADSLESAWDRLSGEVR